MLRSDDSNLYHGSSSIMLTSPSSGIQCIRNYVDDAACQPTDEAPVVIKVCKFGRAAHVCLILATTSRQFGVTFRQGESQTILTVDGGHSNPAIVCLDHFQDAPGSSHCQTQTQAEVSTEAGVTSSVKLFARCGPLQVIRKSEMGLQPGPVDPECTADRYIREVLESGFRWEKPK